MKDLGLFFFNQVWRRVCWLGLGGKAEEAVEALVVEAVESGQRVGQWKGRWGGEVAAMLLGEEESPSFFSWHVLFSLLNVALAMKHNFADFFLCI